MSRVALVLLLAFVAASSLAQSQESGGNQHEQTTAEHTHAGQQQQIDRLADTLNTGNQSLINQLRSMQTQAEAEAIQKHADRNSLCSPSMILQVLLLLVGVAYTIFAALQWGAISNTNQANRDNLHLAHRPWIVTDRMEVKEFREPESGEPNVTVKFQFHLVNCGSTPALGIKTTVGWCVLDIPACAPTNPSYKPPRAKIMETGIIGPGRSMAHFDWIDERARRFADLYSRKRFYIYGIVKYEGSFNRPEPYVTTFCYMKDPDNDHAFTMIGPYNSAS